MGDMAEGLLDGTFDSQTGEYLGEGQGFPRSRERSDGRIHERHNNYNGIVRFITKHYKQHFPMDFQKESPSKSLRYFHSIIREFLRENNVPHERGHKYGIVFGNARKAQKDWPKFVEFLKNRNWSDES